MDVAFYNILLDPSAPHLLLPPAFVSKHWANEIPNYSTIQSANGGYSWKVEIKKIGENYCFVDGWINVVNDIQLRFGNLLVFFLLDESTFKMIVYSPDGCEMILTQKSQDLGGGDEIVENDVDEDGDKEEEEDVGDDDYDYDQDDNYEDGNDEDHDDEVYGNDEAYGVDEYSNEEEKEDVDDDYECDEDGNDEDEVFGYDEEKGGDNNGADPLFESVMPKTNRKYLRFPVSFMKEAKIHAEGTMVLKNLEGNEWAVGVKLDKSFKKLERYLLSSGWCDFRRQNNLLPGDKCEFKFIRSEQKLLLAKVTKKIGLGDDDEEEKEDADDDYNYAVVGNDEDHDQVYCGDYEIGDDKNDVDPFFESIMPRSNMKYLRFPMSFTKAAGIRAEGSMVVKNHEGKEWVMGMKFDKAYKRSVRYLLSSGWCGFRRENNLSEGDKCIFKFIRSEKKLLLAKVTKKKELEEKPQL